VSETSSYKISGIFDIQNGTKVNFYFYFTNIFLVNYQIDAEFFSMYLSQFSASFEQPRAHHQENQLYQYNIWYMSLCTPNGHRHRVKYTRCCIDTIDSPDDEHEVARNTQRIEINT